MGRRRAASVRWAVAGLIAGLIAAAACRAAWALPAFPGAQGFGAEATGGRGGEVFHVVNTLNTNTGTYEGPDGYNRGTLRWCLLTEASSLPRTIVFDVSGQVTLSSQITIENGRMTIAGQTAPGAGLTTAGRPWLIESGDDLIIRYIRSRLGRNGGQDSIGVEGGSRIIFDHVSSSWSNDEALSVAKQGTFVTVQNSFIYEGLNHSGHGYGSLIRPDVDSKVTYHHNLYASNESRNPRPGTYASKTLDFDFRNNVIYNWGDRAGYSGGSSEGNPEYVNMNYVGNYVIAGPATSNNLTSAFLTDNNAATTAYQAGNLIDSNTNGVLDGVDTGWGMFEVEGGTLTQRAGPHPLARLPVTTQAATDAYQSVLDYAGSFWWNRDAHDARIVDAVRNQTGSLINHENDVGGFLPPASVARDATWDADHDGMPDEWERKHGLNPASSPDRNLDFDADEFTNLEEYLNEVGAWPAPQPISWIGGAGRYALNQNWDVWQPSRFDEVRVHNGLVAVDAVGQHAGVLRIAPDTGDIGHVNITAGRLDVAQEVAIGAVDSTGGLTLAGGTLRTPLLSRGGGGTFALTGGALSADAVAFDLVNSGGVITPGEALGATHVLGDLTLAAGTLQLHVAGSSLGQYDQVIVDGRTTLGGTLAIVPIDAGGGLYQPVLGDEFILLVSQNGFESSPFAAHDLPQLAEGLNWLVAVDGMTLSLSVVESSGLPGDFNHDGAVDGRDFLLWQRRQSPNENSATDLAEWQAGFGSTAPSAAAVPEPSFAALLALAAAACGASRIRRPQRVRRQVR